MVQEIIIGILFVLALFFLGRMVYRAFTQKENCSAGCSCSNVSIKEIEAKMKNDTRFDQKTIS
jgi:FeoB-associated Cys-rich membrane protein